MSVRRTKLNRGQILAAAVEASGMNKEEVALRAGYSRSAYYKHIDNPMLDYHILIAYGRALKHDFTEEFPEMPKYELQDPNMPYGQQPANMEEALREKDYWKDKYLELLEKYNRLIEERIAKK